MVSCCQVFPALEGHNVFAIVITTGVPGMLELLFENRANAGGVNMVHKETELAFCKFNGENESC